MRTCEVRAVALAALPLFLTLACSDSPSKPRPRPGTGGTGVETGGSGGSGGGFGGTGGSGGAGDGGTGGSGARDGGAADGGGGAVDMAVTDDGGMSFCSSTVVAMGGAAMGLIDDFEDGDSAISMMDGRTGGWWLQPSDTAMTDPPKGAPLPVDGGMPGKAFHITGSDIGGGWGAGLSATIVPDGSATPGGCYDASKYTGIKISLKGKPGSQVYVAVLTASVRATNFGSGHFRKAVTLTANWTTVMIPFAELEPGYGVPVAGGFDVKAVYGVDVAAIQPVTPPTPDGGAGDAGRLDGGPRDAARDTAVRDTGTAEGPTAGRWEFDFWVDNVAFY
jgi:hypothetical protein